MERLLNIVEDNKSTKDFLVSLTLWISGALEEKPPIPQLNDAAMADIMSIISEHLTR